MGHYDLIFRTEIFPLWAIMRVQIAAKYGQQLFQKRTVNGNSAKKRVGNKTAASPVNGNGNSNGKPEFENGATLYCTRVEIQFVPLLFGD